MRPPAAHVLAACLAAACLVATCLVAGCSEAPPSAPDETRVDVRYTSPAIPAFGATPTPAQRAWQDMEVTAFVHFGVNTFTGREWGTGDEDPAVFDPSALDALQWFEAARDGGVRGILLTAKHHDGFALWPSRHSDHTVAASPYRGGAGDVVAEAAAAARQTGLEFGVYLSPWDRHEPTWGTPTYNEFFLAQADELTNPTHATTYGRLFEFWLDGAHGDEVTQAQRDTYDVGRWEAFIRRRQPGVLIAFSADIGYSGNEGGFGPETHWKNENGYWQPNECNMPFRGGWFWHENEDPKSVDDLVDAYFRTVGRDCVLLLGLAPDRRGLLEDEDVARLREWRAALDRLFAENVVADLPAEATSTRPGDGGWAAGAATDGEPESFWAADETAAALTVELPEPESVSVIEVREPIRYGQRIAAFAVDAWDGSGWTEVARGTTVGRRRLLRIDPVTAWRWRLRIEDARAAPAVSEFKLYAPAR